MKKIIFLFVFALLLLSGCKRDRAVSTESTAYVPVIVTILELSTHNNINDCWIGYQGDVYDITKFIPEHQGNKLETFCGTADEFENAFVGTHKLTKVDFMKEKCVFIGTFPSIQTDERQLWQ
jgi:hypothetical protein